MATKKKKKPPAKRPSEPARAPKSVPGTPREHRMIDAEQLREDVERKANGDGGR